MGATSDDQDLHPDDRAWRRERFAAGSLIFGLLGVLGSPLLLGLALGPIGMRAGIDLWRAGIRRPVVVLGVAASCVATCASIAAALVWGALLMQVLLTRDVMRETEKWRGETVARTTVRVLGPDGTHERVLAPIGEERRLAILFIEVGAAPCADAVRALAHALERAPQVAVLVVDGSAAPRATRDFIVSHGLDVGAVETASDLPAPLDEVYALPTLVVLDPSGRIESVAVGSRPLDEIDRLLSGEAAPVPSAR
jgi:hypothetical protein